MAKAKTDGRKNNGGARIGASPPLKYGEVTKLVPFKLPISKIDEIRIKFKEILKTYEIK